MATKLDVLRRALPDERSGRVVFVSHCLLNQNVRYLGGATRPGVCDQTVAGLVRAGMGLVQMPCPEQCAWGGVCKRYTVPVYGADRTILRRLRRPATWLFLARTRLVYQRLARRVAAQITDYLRSGYTVESVVGIGGSPSCGVHTTLDLPAVLDDIAGRDLHISTGVSSTGRSSPVTRERDRGCTWLRYAVSSAVGGSTSLLRSTT